MEVLGDIHVSLDFEDVMKGLHQIKGMEECVRDLLEEVRRVARPKAMYEVGYVEGRTEDTVQINGVIFTSRVLRMNLDKVERVFVYVATCGRELDAIPVPQDDMVTSFCLEMIKRMVVAQARSHLDRHLREKYALGQTSRMGPGSLEDWPITQQRQVFSLLGDVEGLIGVALTQASIMVPLKSVSGMLFPTEVKFESCQLCPRETCEGRRAVFDPMLARKYGVAMPSHVSC